MLALIGAKLYTYDSPLCYRLNKVLREQLLKENAHLFPLVNTISIGFVNIGDSCGDIAGL